MAAGLPRATLVGIDGSARQIEDARRVAVEAGARRTSPSCGRASTSMAIVRRLVRLRDLPRRLSWIPESARAALLERIARALRGNGVAYVSFNVLPGWYNRLAARDWLRFAASSLGRPAEDAVASLAWLAAQLSPEQADARRRLGAVARRLEETGPAYAAHEYLAPEQHPLLVSAFLADASAAGLGYLGDAVPATTALNLLPDEARERARTLDPIAAQQLVDFVRCTAFRRALLVRADAARTAKWSASDLDAEALRVLRVAGRLRPKGPRDPGQGQEAFEDRGARRPCRRPGGEAGAARARAGRAPVAGIRQSSPS